MPEPINIFTIIANIISINFYMTQSLLIFSTLFEERILTVDSFFFLFIFFTLKGRKHLRPECWLKMTFQPVNYLNKEMC